MADTVLRVEGLTVRYGDAVAVDALDLEAADGEVVAVLGPSGCGKSTLLRAVAGLEPAAAGRIHLADQDVTAARPDQRLVGLMFQDHALFPHRTVAQNVAFGPRMQGASAAEQRSRVREVLRLVDLDGFEDRPVTQLSGGERQRVALARALAPRPRLLMLDEPLGSLDRALGDRLLGELTRVFAEVGTTVLHVTHDQDEALAVADRVAVMRAGRIVQEGTPDELWRTPRTEFVARFLGLEHVVDGTVRQGVAHTPLGELPVDGLPDGPVRLVLLPDALRVTDELQPLHVEEVGVRGEITARRFAGDHLRLRVRTRGGLDLTVPAWRGAIPHLGERVLLGLDPRNVRPVTPER